MTNLLDDENDDLPLQIKRSRILTTTRNDGNDGTGQVSTHPGQDGIAEAPRHRDGQYIVNTCRRVT